VDADFAEVEADARLHGAARLAVERTARRADDGLDLWSYVGLAFGRPLRLALDGNLFLLRLIVFGGIVGRRGRVRAKGVAPHAEALGLRAGDERRKLPRFIRCAGLQDGAHLAQLVVLDGLFFGLPLLGFGGGYGAELAGIDAGAELQILGYAGRLRTVLFRCGWATFLFLRWSGAEGEHE